MLTGRARQNAHLLRCRDGVTGGGGGASAADERPLGDHDNPTDLLVVATSCRGMRPVDE